MSNLVTEVGVHIKIKSIEKSRKFYEDFLELNPVFAYGSPEFLKTIPAGVPTAPDHYSGITYGLPGKVRIEIAEGHIAVKDKKIFEDPIVSPKISAMITVKSLIPLLKKGLLADRTVTKYYWGTIEVVARDPDGWVIVLIAPYSEEEWSAVRKLAKNTEEVEFKP